MDVSFFGLVFFINQSDVYFFDNHWNGAFLFLIYSADAVIPKPFYISILPDREKVSAI